MTDTDPKLIDWARRAQSTLAWYGENEGPLHPDARAADAALVAEGAQLLAPYAPAFDPIAYTDALPLVDALWWFIENGSPESLFFRLRERVREAAPPTVAVFISGGNWQGCAADAPVTVLVADYDNDLVTDPDGEACRVGSEEPDIDPARVAAFKELAR